MAQFIIEGKQKLQGDVFVGGMKNAATPILAATLLTDETCVVSNVPRIVDVFKMLELLEGLGASVQWTDEHTVSICCKGVDPQKIIASTVRKLRSSVLLIGPLLARFREIEVPHPGGCIIGNRPMDVHLDAMRALGADVEEGRATIHFQRGDRLKGAAIVLSEFSVTATENVLLAAVTAQGTTTIHIAAAEPHVQDLARFLVKMGARIDGIGTHVLTIHGEEQLHGARHELIPDQIEIGTWAVVAAVTRGKIAIHNINPDHLHLLLLKFRQAGVTSTIDGSILTIQPTHRIRAFRVQTLPYPGFPTDLQAPFAVLATQAEGTSLIHDPMYEGRLGYVQELIKMGANAVICDPHRVLITGPTPLYGQDITSFDLRAGATLIVAALIAQGTTTIREAQIVDRGYEAIDERLRSLGAHITRKDE
ncbi:MAG: UDP-N-acetylglucosamine 1-carboxyvinyltransferase [bacterium]